jgi:uncharacterized protein YodC (DUF2158 family)
VGVAVALPGSRPAIQLKTRFPMRPTALILTAGIALSSVSVIGKWISPVMAAPDTSHVEKQSVHARLIRAGDLVRLRSGGPLMTVREVEGDQITCYWSTDEGNVLSGSFPIADLTAPITLPTAD